VRHDRDGHVVAAGAQLDNANLTGVEALGRPIDRLVRPLDDDPNIVVVVVIVAVVVVVVIAVVVIAVVVVVVVVAVVIILQGWCLRLVREPPPAYERGICGSVTRRRPTQQGHCQR
jgi:hypothetical protein